MITLQEIYSELDGRVIIKKSKKFLGFLLTDIRFVVYYHCMTMVREAIIKRMKELNLNPNQLSEMLKGEIPRQTIYNFLSSRTDARSEVVSGLIKALGLELKPKKKKVR